MDKNAIKKYAIWARNELIAKVSQKAAAYGIEKDNIVDANADSIDGVMLSSVEKKQRKALIEQINEKGYEQVIEEVAYTWFNRFTAIRFMEVNGYLPSHIRVFTDDDNNFKPQILTEAIHLNDVFEKINMDKVFELKQEDKTEELYKYLLIIQCNALNAVLPRMFQTIEDYSELLLPDYLLREGSVIEKMVNDLPEIDFNVESGNGQVEIIGWLYQYYNDEKKTSVIDMAKKTVVSKENIPAATQLFTTDWVVRYIVDNSLGRYWIERHPESSLKDELEYFADNGNPENIEQKGISPQSITFFDPCIGSGHFTLYAFSVFIRIYVECGYSEREAVSLILQNNLFGVDIDERAAQLAYFSIMMKARQYDRRFFTRNIQPHILSVPDSNGISEDVLQVFVGDDSFREKDIKSICEELRDGKEYGSLLACSKHDYDSLYARIDELNNNIGLFNKMAVESLLPLIMVSEILSKKYTVVATNPPYLNKYNAKLKAFLDNHFKDYSGDLFSAFIYRNCEFCIPDGYTGFMTPFVWMFIKTYEKLRNYIIDNKNIVSLIQFEYSAYEEATVPICSFVLRNTRDDKEGIYFRLTEFKGGMTVQQKRYKEGLCEKNCKYVFLSSKKDFKRIPGKPIAYWLSAGMLDAFDNSKTLSYYGQPKVGLQTGDTNRFLRYWYEPQITKICFAGQNSKNKKWFPICKGGEYRRWYGNNDYVVNWENNGFEIKNFKDEKGRLKSRPQNVEFYFKKGITWNLISSSNFAVRCYPEGMVFDVSANAFFCSDELYYYIAGVLNSKIIFNLSQILNPTINFSAGVIANLPIKVDIGLKHRIDELVAKAIEIEKIDWDSFETSWDFRTHPLIPVSNQEKKSKYISDYYESWEKECDKRFLEMKTIEEELNQIFIDIYELNDELLPAVEDKDVTIRKADIRRDIRGFISFAVGCLFGRYSIDAPGLIYAGGEWDESKYHSFKPDVDAIIPICDDEYFEDDIVGRFISFVETVFGKETLEDNLMFISDSLGGKGSSRKIIRNYFLNDFYADHLKIYQKRPIYWLFDSGKKNGFKCLVYMHRYKSDTIARIRTDYVHEQQARYRTAIIDLDNRINNISTSEKVKLSKVLNNLKAQDEELRVYEEKIHHLADQMIEIDLDDGVKKNYAMFQDVLAKIK